MNLHYWEETPFKIGMESPVFYCDDRIEPFPPTVMVKVILKDIQLGQAYLVSGRDELILHSGFKTTIVQLGPFLDPPTLKVQYFFWCNLQ